MTIGNSIGANPHNGGDHGTSDSSPSGAQALNQANRTSTAQPRATTPPATATQHSSTPPAAPPATTREPVVKTTWKTITSKYPPVSLWIIAFLSLVFAALARDKAAEEALELAKWTALKDFREQCKELIDSGSTTPACALVTSKSLPVPPYFNLTMFKRAMVAIDWNATMAPIYQLFLTSDQWKLTETKGRIVFAIFVGQLIANGMVFSRGTVRMNPANIFVTLTGVLIGYTLLKDMTYMGLCLSWFLNTAYLTYLLILYKRQRSNDRLYLGQSRRWIKGVSVFKNNESAKER